MKRWMPAIVGLIGIAAFVQSAGACPMCKDSIPNSDAAQASSLPSGFNTSVYYMLGGLFVTIGLVTSAIVKGVRSTPVHLPSDPRRPPTMRKPPTE